MLVGPVSASRCGSATLDGLILSTESRINRSAEWGFPTPSVQGGYDLQSQGAG